MKRKRSQPTEAVDENPRPDPGLDLPPELLEQARILASPARFARHYLGVELRDYQEEILERLPRRLLLRWARQVGKSFVCALLAVWYAFTHANSRVVVVYPVEDQVHAFFRDHVRPLLARAPDLFQASVDQDTRDPETIRFVNGSTILGFTAGTRSSAQAVSVRGQGADLLILDEMHYMDDEDVNSVLPLVASRTDAIIVAASTCRVASGKFYEFYQNAHDPDPENRIWYDSHVPGWKSPTWDPKRSEREWKVLLGEDGYLREIAVEFIAADTTTVFPPAFVYRAAKDYPYARVPRHPNSVRVIGVDWDVAQATPTIAVCEWDATECNDSGSPGMLRLVLRDEIPRSEFTLDMAVQRVIELNGIFRPHAIYVDRGFGEYQVETLHKMGKMARSPSDSAWGLDAVVKGIWFSQTIEIPDPATGVPERKPLKPFMVNQLALLFERDRIRISSHDTALIRQLLDYRIKRIGLNGRPIYTAEREHAVDVLGLCVLAILENFPHLVNMHVEIDHARVSTAPSPYEPAPSVPPVPPPLFVHAGPSVAIRVSPPAHPNEPHFATRAAPGRYLPMIWRRGSLGRAPVRRGAAF